MLFVVSTANQAKTKAKRAERIIELLERPDKVSLDASIQAEVLRLLKQQPIGFDPNLSAPDGWFDRASPALTRMAFESQASALVEWFFYCFQFVGGQQSAVLGWLNNLLQRAAADPAALATVERIADRVLAPVNSAEASWFYNQVLEQLRGRQPSSQLRTLALSVGRRAYSAGRTDRRPTVSVYRLIFDAN